MSRWFAAYRLTWIGETVRVFGFINREHLMRKFGISTPQASKDLQEFDRAHPGVMAYDRSRKQYVATPRVVSPALASVIKRGLLAD